MKKDIKKIINNATVNAELESKNVSQETIEMIENCLKTDNGSFLFHLYLKSKKNINSDYFDLNGSKNSKYCYENGVLINNYDIREYELLHIVESDSAAYYQTQIIGGFSDYKFGFDIFSYLALHNKLFSAIYPFAGEIRDEFIYKSCLPYFDRKTPFCLPQFIKGCLENTLLEMKNNILKIYTRDELLIFLSYYYGELNMIHPFREGNGRTLRTYFLLLVNEINKYIDFGTFELDYSLWDFEDKENLIRGTIMNSIDGNIDIIMDCFNKVLINKAKKDRVYKRRMKYEK